MSNLPPGTTQRDIDKLCASDHEQHRQEECYFCLRLIEQDSATGKWFDADEFPYFKPAFRSDFLDSFPTDYGWVCSTDCFNERCVTVEQPKLFLVKGGTV